MYRGVLIREIYGPGTDNDCYDHCLGTTRTHSASKFIHELTLAPLLGSQVPSCP